MERPPVIAARRRRLGLCLTMLGLVAAGLYGATLWRFGVMLAGG